MNGSDCGMFSCKYAEYVTRDAPITFTQVGSVLDHLFKFLEFIYLAILHFLYCVAI